VEYDTKFLTAEQSGDGVIAHAERRGEALELRASFVVGCDGAHSAVRALMGVPFEGGEYHAAFMLADIDTNETLPADQMQICPHASGPLAIFPMSATRRRVVAATEEEQGDAPSLELVRRLLADRGPPGIEARALRWSSYFHIHHRQVATLRAGRIFIAGDAAHIHSPFGGQGMNTGLQDAWNLVWKLDLAVRGHAADTLLDSYTAERRPVIKEVIETTDLLTRGMATPSKLAQTLRNALIPAMSHLPPLQHAFVNRLSGLKIAYHGSPIVEGHGDRYFDETVRGGKGIASRFLLVGDQRGQRAMQEALRQLPESLNGMVELRFERREDTVLVRPDGYVAYSDRSRPEVQTMRSVRAVLQRQVH
jgi:2-polyprenyl-6-methoxyphenol hydroxylase-like FAD-dependent oxidoreductase